MSVTATPVAAGERIDTLDAIRGFALLGIFIMNMPFFNTSFFAGADGTHLWPQWWDRGAATFREVVFSGKFNSMFSMLFAIGFTIQLERLLEREPDRAIGIYVRRISWLLVFGVIHACVFWIGDILHMYALFGFLLLVIRRLPERVIIGLIVACLLYPAIAGVVRLQTTSPADVERMVALAQQWMALDNEVYRHGSFFEIARRNAQTMWFFYADADSRMGMIGGYVQILTTMLLGLVLGRRRFFQNVAANLPFVRSVQWWALAIGLACGAGFGAYLVMVENPMAPSVWGVLASMCYVICRVAIMVFYVSLIIRGMQNARWRERMAPVTLAGRMPLTNYLMQTLIATFLFFGWGLGLWGTIGPALDLVLAIAIFFLIQVPLTRLWFSRFQLGPMEYLWRVLTYGRSAIGSISRKSAATEREAAVG
jgi:uncharacterized protein